MTDDSGTVHAHFRADVRSLALHREVARRLRVDPLLVDAARERIDDWDRAGSVDLRYLEAWRDLLDRPIDWLIGVMLADDERSRDLRQVSPFAGVIDARTRWRVLAEADGAQASGVVRSGGGGAT